MATTKTSAKASTKGRAIPVKKPAKKSTAVTKRTALPGSAQAEAQGRVQAAQLAQIVNLHIGGFSLAQIGDAIGATEAEVDRMLAQDVGRYVRSQPALRVFVRNFISEKYLGMLDSIYPQAIDATNEHQLDYQDRALRVLNQMAKLHGAEMPTQSEVKLDAAPELVETMVEVLSRSQGMGYDPSIFDTIDAEVVEDAHDEAVAALEQSAANVTEGDEDL